MREPINGIVKDAPTDLGVENAGNIVENAVLLNNGDVLTTENNIPLTNE
jgi:hypothetical protein